MTGALSTSASAPGSSLCRGGRVRAVIIDMRCRPLPGLEDDWLGGELALAQCRPPTGAGHAPLRHGRPAPGRPPSRYNDVHGHGGLGLHTLTHVHHGHAGAVREQRAVILSAAYDAHPERFVRKPPVPPKIPTNSWINPPEEMEAIAQ